MPFLAHCNAGIFDAKFDEQMFVWDTSGTPEGVEAAPTGA
jgi:hypothetical protein